MKRKVFSVYLGVLIFSVVIAGCVDNQRAAFERLTAKGHSARRAAKPK